MFKLHSVWCQVFNIKQFGEFCYLKQKRFRFIPDFHSRNCSMAWSHWARKKKEKKKATGDLIIFLLAEKLMVLLHAFQNCSDIRGVTLCCSTRKSPFCLETAAGLNMMILFLSTNTELRTPVMMDSHLPSSLPLLQRHFLALVFAKLSLLQTRNSKPEKQKERTTSYILSFPLLFRKPPAPLAIQLYLKPGSWLSNTLWHIRYPWGPTAGSDVP